ncbi:MAG: glycosyl hydrolase 43 family protein [Verrucomicrobia bacterium]|nr:MAG: glycosyl hydrolase 43 family protein [Verrucomicrobiota bacterium]
MNPTTKSSTGADTASRCVYPWTPDQGDGTYRNPILCADYSDPDVVRHGDDFWMTASSFNCTPGLPILHSRDLVNWTLVNHALKNVPGERYNEVQPGCGVWAPSIRFHAGKFWIFFPAPDEGLYVTTATDPRGTWSEPHLVQAGKGLIDPCPLWDDDGNAYLAHAYAHSRSGIKHKLRVAPMSLDGTRLLGEGRIVFHEPERHHTMEGPKFLKRDGWYYILAPAGGVATGWQVVLRSRNIFGPYEDKIVLQQGRTPINGPHQGALVDTANGDWWFMHFQDVGVYGRVVHLQPVAWREGWPLMGALHNDAPTGEPVLQHPKPKLPIAPIATPATSDEFNSSKLGLQWQWHANHRHDWYSLTARPGWLRLFGQAVPQNQLLRAPHLLLQKFPAREFTVEAQLDFSGGRAGDEAGLIIMGRAHAAIALRKTEFGTQLVFRNGGEQLFDETANNTVRFRVVVQEAGVCDFSYVGAEGHWTAMPTTFQAQAGVWIGAKLGLFAAGQGHADFDYFRFTPLPGRPAPRHV